MSFPAPREAGWWRPDRRVGPVIDTPGTKMTFVPRLPAPVRRRHRVLAAATGVLLVAALAAAAGLLRAGPGGAGPAPAGACGPSWTTAWEAAAQPLPAPPALLAAPAGGTLRLLVHPQVTGSQVRVRLSNAFGSGPLQIGAVSAARAGRGAAVTGPVRGLTFGGAPGVLVPPGATVTTDPAPLPVEAGVPLAVSVFLPRPPATLTGHSVALQTSYLSAMGDATADGGGAFGTALTQWPVLTGLDVLAPRPVHAVVALGDSITDGVGSPLDGDARWSDALAARLDAAGGTTTMAVLNAGISGNRLLDDDPAGGPSLASRFGRDAAGARGATDVLLNIGTNDIAAGRDAADIEAGLVRVADEAHGSGQRVFITTITPSEAGAHGTPAAIATRDAVNAWIRAHGREHADGVLDFAAAVADPLDPARLAPGFDAGDGLHLSAAGYRMLAGTVDLAALTGSPCLGDGVAVRLASGGG